MKNLARVAIEKHRLESVIKQVVDTYRIAGLAVVIINDNKVVYNHTIGVKEHVNQ